MIDFAHYDVDPVRGFLPAEDPLTELPAEFAAWDQLGAELPYLLLTARLRRAVAKLETPDLSLLTSPAELERAMLILSAAGMAYIWGEEPAANHIPASLAVPWAAIAQRLGRPPIVTHSSIVLNNWRRINAEEVISADNLACIQHFLGGMDEQWFFTATAALEYVGAAALVPLVKAKQESQSEDLRGLEESLEQILLVFKDVNAALLRIYERCDPYIFYYRIRPFLTGWDQNGVLFEGVSETPFKLHGGSAAQSSLIQAFDAGLGIEHLHVETAPFLSLMRDYMPPKHRGFLEALSGGDSVYDCVQRHKASSPKLELLFNACIDQLDEFRRAHMEIAVRYILKAAGKGEDGLGTGGTSFVPFLSESRKETKAKRTKSKLRGKDAK